MLSNSKPAKLILYLVCAAIIGRTFTYLIARYSEIFDSVIESQSISAAIYTFYLCLVLTWSLLVLTGWNHKAFFSGMFTYAVPIVLVFSLALIAVFYFIPLQEFQPLELVYVVYDMSILAVIMCALCWLIGTPNIDGILALNRRNKIH